MSRLASTFMSIGRVLEERTGWGRRRKPAPVAPSEVIDDEVLSEIFSKLGIETKIDQIEAEFDAEAKAARTAARSKIPVTKSAPPEKAPPSHFDVYGNPETHVQHHKLWTTSVCVLGVVLVIQSVFLFRNHLARSFPGTRPALISLCNTFGCTMPLPREASRIEIADYGFARRSDRSDRYVFYAKVTNSANFAQDWPNLELVLKNDIHQPLSRRIFTPTEWVPPERFAQSTGMPARSNVDINMELEVTGIVPSNFDLGHFYP